MRLIAALASLLLLAGCDMDNFGPSDRFQSDFHYSWDLKPGGHLNIESFSGPIDIYASDDAAKVDISGVRYASTQENLDSIRVEDQHTADRAELRAPRPTLWHGNGGVRLTIRVPKTTILDNIRTWNGTIHVRGVAGKAHLQTSNGAIRIEDVADTVEAQTSNGAIELDSVSGGATLKTSNGRIRAENHSGPIDAETSNGGITVNMRDAGPVASKLSTSNGSIQLTMLKAPQANLRADTSNGGITVYLPPDSAARIHAGGASNSITSEFSVDGSSDRDRRDGRLDGAIGKGGPVLDLSSNHGSIKILKGDRN